MGSNSIYYLIISFFHLILYGGHSIQLQSYISCYRDTLVMKQFPLLMDIYIAPSFSPSKNYETNTLEHMFNVYVLGFFRIAFLFFSAFWPCCIACRILIP